MVISRRLVGAALVLLMLPVLGGLLPSPVAARANGPILRADYSLADLGFSDTVLQGIEPSVEFFFFGPQGVPLRPEGNYINLVLAYSPLLLEDSTVSVELNSSPVAGRYLTEDESQRREIRIELPAEDILADVNSLRISFFMHLSDDACVDARNPALTVTILADTILHYAYDTDRPEVPPTDFNIADFPAPMLLSFDPNPPIVNLVVPDVPSAADLSVAISVAGELGKTYQPFADPVIRVLRASEVGPDNRRLDTFILIGQPEANPLVAEALTDTLSWEGSDLLVGGTALEPDSGIVAVVGEPGGGSQQTLLVTGNSPAGVAAAGRLLVTPAVRSTVEQPISIVKAPAVAEKSEGATNELFEISLDDLGVGSRAITGSGTHAVAFTVVAPPPSQIDTSELILELSHSPLLSQDSTVTVEINGTKVDSLRLDSVGVGRDARRVSLPPAVLQAGANEVIIFVETFFDEPTECGGPPEVGAWVELDGRTRMAIRPQGGVVAPGLSEFPYPFVLGLDTGDFAVVISPEDDFAALGRLGVALGAWLNAETRWVPAALDTETDLQDAGGGSYIIFGTVARNALLAELMPDLPLRLSSVGGRLIESPARALVGLPDNAEVGILQVIQSPWNPRARLLVVTATSSAMLPRAVEALIDPDFPVGANLMTISADGRAGVLSVEMPLVVVDEVDVRRILVDNLPAEVAGVVMLAIAIGAAYVVKKNVRAGSGGQSRSQVDVTRGLAILLGAWVVTWLVLGLLLLPAEQQVFANLLLGVVALAPFVVLHRGSAPLVLLAAIVALVLLALREAITEGVDIAARLTFSVIVLAITATLADLTARRLGKLRDDVFRQQRRIDDLTTLDPETGAYKGEWGESRLAEEVGRSARLRQPFSLLLVSADDWDDVVAEDGRRAAAELLRQATDVIKEMQRTPDRVWRAGPADLAMLLPGTPLEGAEVVATRTVDSIMEECGLKVVIGIAVFPADGGDSLKLLDEANSAKDFASMAGLPQASRRMLEI